MSNNDNNILTTKDEQTPIDGEQVLELNDNFDLDGFQVVRREFFAHIKEPSISFIDCKLFVNAACIAKFPNTNYAQVLVNQSKKILALRPCDETARDAFMWCTASNGKRKPKQNTCRLFFAKLYALMNWNPKYKYKLLGKLIHSKGEYLIAFDMTATEVYQRMIGTDEKPKTSRTPIFPAEWQNQFGLPFSEHKQSLQINIFDGYAIYSINDSSSENITVSKSDGGNSE